MVTIVDVARTGAQVYVQYGWESNYGVEATTINKAFGHDVRLSVTPRQNLIVVRSVGTRNAVKSIGGRYEGVLSVSFIAANSYFLKAVLGGVDDSGSGPWLHTYKEQDTVPSMTIEAGYDLGTTDMVRKFLGVKVNNMTISTAIGEPVRVTLDCVYKTEARGTSLDSTPATESEDPMVFSQGAVDWNGTGVNRVQSIDASVGNNLIPVYALNSRMVSSVIEGARDYTGRMTHTLENVNTVLADFGTGASDPSEKAYVKLYFDNGAATTANRAITLKFGSAVTDTDTVNTNPNELINEDVTFRAERMLIATGTDNTNSTP